MMKSSQTNFGRRSLISSAKWYKIVERTNFNVEQKQLQKTKEDLLSEKHGDIDQALIKTNPKTIQNEIKEIEGKVKKVEEMQKSLEGLFHGTSEIFNFYEDPINWIPNALHNPQLDRNEGVK